MKILLRERESPVAVAIWHGADYVASARLLYPEARAALAAARRAGRLSPSVLTASRAALDRRFAEVDVVELSESVARAAGEAAERYRLRAGDAIHLASALVVSADVICTWAGELRRAAFEAGLAVAP